MKPKIIGIIVFVALTAATGQIVVGIMRGNMHAFFGDWRDPLVKIGFSSILWVSVWILGEKMFEYLKKLSRKNTSVE